MPQRVEGGDSGAEQRRSFGVTQTFRYRRQRLDRCGHVLLVSTVIADTGYFHVPAITKISATALGARAVVAAVPTDADTLPLYPPSNARAYLIDTANDFVSGNAWILNAGQRAFFRQHVAVADAAGLHLDAHLTRAGVRNLALDYLEICPRRRNLRHLHQRYCDFCRCHNASC
jgi:hypothetical protein